MRKWQAIVFDLDDTIYPERNYVLSGFSEVALWAKKNLRIQANQGFVELKHLFEIGVRADTFNRWLSTHNLPVDEIVPQLLPLPFSWLWS